MTGQNSDSFFGIGKGHPICQDYARSGMTKQGLPYAVVCDGCSTSPDTDFGARMLAVAAEAQLRAGILPSIERTVEMLRCNVDWLGLPSRSFDATMVAALSDGVDVHVRMWGDGVVVARRRDDQLEIHAVEHTKNAPMYASYFLDDDRRAGYASTFGSLHRVSSFIDSRWSVRVGVDLPLADWTFPLADYALVAVMSDGVSSFQCPQDTGTSRTLQSIPLEVVVQDFLDIKTVSGMFVQRRCLRFLGQVCPTRGWQHTDDVAVAAIFTGEQDESLRPG